MTAESNGSTTKDSRNPQRTEAKAVAAPPRSPQSNPLTREEIRKLVIDQIG
ncbi:hypothetical protein AAII07_13595 [Microvirga sp. 0TCS3.31]